VARLKDGQRSSRSARATSCGGIVLRSTDGGPEIVLGKRRRDRNSATWSLPKGTPSGDESSEQTALREVAEETGLEVEIVAPVGSIEYFFTQHGTRVHKTVHYFLMHARGGDLATHDHEFDEVRWVDLETAREMMTFPTERDILERALPLAGVV
jgi:8-oxo-dGTP pyrophosphatase MutT (NUDIX family)